MMKIKQIANTTANSFPGICFISYTNLLYESCQHQIRHFLSSLDVLSDIQIVFFLFLKNIHSFLNILL